MLAILSARETLHVKILLIVVQELREGAPQPEDSLSAALQADAFLAAAQPLLAFALALRRSWRDKCPGKLSGTCPPWAAMSRPEFLNAYFAPIAAAIGRGERVAESGWGWEPHWSELLLPPASLTLYRYLGRQQQDGQGQGYDVKDVLRASSISVSNNHSVASTSSVTVLDPAFHPEEVRPVRLLHQGCTTTFLCLFYVFNYNFSSCRPHLSIFSCFLFLLLIVVAHLSSCPGGGVRDAAERAQLRGVRAHVPAAAEAQPHRQRAPHRVLGLGQLPGPRPAGRAGRAGRRRAAGRQPHPAG